jgi:hypothetical protein
MYESGRSTVPGGVVRLTFTGILCLLALFFIPKTVEFQSAQEVMVIQYPSGTLAWFTEQGPHMQWFGHVTKYDRRFQIEFLAPKEKEKKGTPLSAIHAKYGTQETITTELLRPVVEKAVYMTGPLMSSTESSAERRNELLNLIEDQIDLGVYKTKTEEIKEPDPMTGAMKTVNKVTLVTDEKGVILRQDVSPLQEFSIKTFNLSLNEIDYEDTVETQIAEQQKAVMQVQTAMANAKKAEQDAITAEKNGQAAAAKAKWDQEALKATAVTKAEQELAVAKLERDTAEQQKQKQILLGQGEAERRRLVMSADNALDARLDAYVKVNERYAQALENIKQPLVPTVVSGGNGAGQTAVQTLIDLLTAKTAKEIGVSAAPSQK